MSAHWPQKKQELVCVKYSSKEIALGNKKVQRMGISVSSTQGDCNELDTDYKLWLLKCVS